MLAVRNFFDEGDAALPFARWFRAAAQRVHNRVADPQMLVRFVAEIAGLAKVVEAVLFMKVLPEARIEFTRSQRPQVLDAL